MGCFNSLAYVILRQDSAAIAIVSDLHLTQSGRICCFVFVFVILMT